MKNITCLVYLFLLVSSYSQDTIKFMGKDFINCDSLNNDNRYNYLCENGYYEIIINESNKNIIHYKQVIFSIDSLPVSRFYTNPYRYSKPLQEFSFYKNGKIQRFSIFDHIDSTQMEFYFDNKSRIYHIVELDFKISNRGRTRKTYYEKGKLAKIENYKHDLLNEISYYDRGKLLKKENYDKGLLVEYTFYRKKDQSVKKTVKLVRTKDDFHNPTKLYYVYDKKGNLKETNDNDSTR